MELISLRVQLREFLTGKTHSNPVDALGKFPCESIRGDFVPTIAEAYQALIETINRDRHTGKPEQLTLSLPVAKKLRLRVQVFNETTGAWETNQ
jgi:hypothetical protein